jgi:hypothetical protein
MTYTALFTSNGLQRKDTNIIFVQLFQAICRRCAQNIQFNAGADLQSALCKRYTLQKIALHNLSQLLEISFIIDQKKELTLYY